MEVSYVRRNEVARTKEYAGLDGHSWSVASHRNVALCYGYGHVDARYFRRAVDVHYDCSISRGESGGSICSGGTVFGLMRRMAVSRPQRLLRLLDERPVHVRQ
jgi:hypothetical protein